MEERLQKIMAKAGIGSRRACDAMIADGRVMVNGQIAVAGMKADPLRDTILVDGNRLPKPETRTYIALYKPRSVLSTVDSPDGRTTVRDLVPVKESVFPVGRLDFDSEGLILMTNDGELTDRLTHPRYEHEKEYLVLVTSIPDEKQLQAWRNGVVLDDGFKTNRAQVSLQKTSGNGTWLRVIMKEGHKRQIRETGAQIGLTVTRILRLRIATLRLGRLKPGEWRYLSESEVRLLRESSDLQPLKRSTKIHRKHGRTGRARNRKTSQTSRQQSHSTRKSSSIHGTQPDRKRPPNKTRP